MFRSRFRSCPVDHVPIMKNRCVSRKKGIMLMSLAAFMFIFASVSLYFDFFDKGEILFTIFGLIAIVLIIMICADNAFAIIGVILIYGGMLLNLWVSIEDITIENFQIYYTIINAVGLAFLVLSAFLYSSRKKKV